MKRQVAQVYGGQESEEEKEGSEDDIETVFVQGKPSRLVSCRSAEFIGDSLMHGFVVLYDRSYTSSNE